MSVITQSQDPMTMNTITLAEGVVKKVKVTAYQAGQKGVDDDGIRRTRFNGKVIEASHKIAILLAEGEEEVWVNLGDKMVKNPDKPIGLKQTDGTWKDLVEGLKVRLLVTGKEYNGKMYYSGKLSKILVLGDAPAGAKQQQQTPRKTQQKAPQQPKDNKAVNPSQAEKVKVYGPVKAVDGNVVTIEDEKLGEGKLILTPEQIAEGVEVGVRVTALVDKNTGKVLSNFKVYTQKGKEGAKRKSGYDPIGVSTGHAINALAELLQRGFEPVNQLETCKQLHSITAKLQREYAEDLGTTPEVVGASVGNAILNGCRRCDLDEPNIIVGIYNEARAILINLAEPLYAYIKEHPQGEDVNVEQPQPHQEDKQNSEPLSQSNTVDAPPTDYNPDEQFDWDDDVPF
ncbi:MAG: hypothetical protein ACI4UM_08135 [Succinivibrio sp.]